ncbi:DUF167 family protein [Sphingomonas sanxanigenens]|uniref:UPF0235 protein NX02_07285 n=1 Tax=Sphingomonas sanxanigenens DSM 19645 = NX02 TaxID=1123269 RepID=W0AA36_9SPHN|nr:DUF167 family protein [Sphingomonas sanxanigenens]AHE53183.1 hypothetical protein NX02_07285 [Sphingomonas sanxanigenens DSM 19645 = NX02]
MLPATPHAEGLRIAVRVTPRASRDAIEGVAADAAGRPELRVRITAAPVDGSANTAVIALLAKALDVPRRDTSLLSGTTARSKQLLVKGDPAVLSARLATLVGA